MAHNISNNTHNKNNNKKFRKKAEDVPEPAEESEDWLWGINAVGEALQQQAASIGEILVEQGKAGPRLQRIIDQAREYGVALRFVEERRLKTPDNSRHQGVMARLSQTPLLSFEALLADMQDAVDARCARLLVLDSIQDPRNLGSILRSALAAGFGHVLLTRERSAPLSGAVARSSAGAISHLKICQAGNLAQALEQLKKHQFWVFGAVVDREATSIYEADFSGSLALVIGSEGKGIRPLVQKHCDLLVTIPMRAAFNSLNASAAAAVILFEIARRG